MNLQNFLLDVKEHAITHGSIPFWSWNDRLDEEELRRQIRVMHELGMNGFFMHARGGLETEYLSDEWFSCVDACVDEAKKYGNEDNFVTFTSTSKITYAGAGVSAMAASDRNFKEISERLTLQIISYDKMNQLRHSYFYKTVDDVKEQMKKHAAILRPKFATVLKILSAELGELGVAKWNEPKGGYFLSLDVTTGSAKYVGELCKKAGVTLTGVGATYPYGIDPEDKNIRLAPSCPTVPELEIATEIICLAVKLAACKEIREGK